MQCKTLQCEEEGGKRSGYCQKCQAGFRYWTAKRPAQVLKRRNDLLRFGSRVNKIINDRGIKS